MRYYWYIFFLIGVVSCANPEPRRPIKVKSGSFFGGEIERNRKLLAMEEQMIQEIIKRDSLHLYENSGSGSWYYYQQKNDATTYKPHTDDLVTLTYNIMGLNNDTIYSHKDIGIVTYKVDKQELFQGLRNSIKILKENETATFLYPSSLAFGYQGDNDRIGVNVPIKSTITLLKVEKYQDSIP